MIYSIVGTNIDTRKKALKELALLFTVTRYVYSEHVEELRSLVDANSLFGDPVVIGCSQLGDTPKSKEQLLEMLVPMKESATTFIIDEPFADVHLINRLTKVSHKVFNAKEEKQKDTSVFTLCRSFGDRDKKQAWIDFMHVKKVEPAESIQGALWWKWKEVWQSVLDGKKSLFTYDDCKRIGRDITYSTILAHRGEKDLITELERIILTL